MYILKIINFKKILLNDKKIFIKDKILIFRSYKTLIIIYLISYYKMIKDKR